MQAEVVRIALRLSGIAATLLHLAHTVEKTGRAFTTEKSAAVDITSDSTGQSPVPTAVSMRQSNTSMSARGRIARLKGESGDITAGADDDSRDGSGAKAGKRVTLLPELRKALPLLNLPTRAHAAVAAMLARSLHSDQDVLPMNLVKLSNQCVLFSRGSLPDAGDTSEDLAGARVLCSIVCCSTWVLVQVSRLQCAV
jgi:hypothetical protein